MTVMPDVNDLVDVGTTELEFQTALAAFHAVVAEMAGQGNRDTQSISGGDITPAKAFVMVDSEGDAASDDLDHVLPNTIGSKILILMIESAARPITLKHNVSGTGKLVLREAADLVLTTTHQMVAFYYDSANSLWRELWRNFGVYAPATADQTAARSALGLGSLATKSSVAAGDIDSNAVTTGKISDNNVTLAKLATQAANTFLANATGGTAVPSAVALAASQLAGRGSTGNIAPIVLGTGLSMSGTTLSVTAAGGAIDIQTFTSSGTWTKPGSGTYAIIRGWGGGGGGASSSSASHGGGGGGGGAYVEMILPLSALSSTETVTIGAGGSSVTSGAGNAGGNTTLGTKFTAYGGGAGAGASTTSKGGGGGGGANEAGKQGGTNASLAAPQSVLDMYYTWASGRGGGPDPGVPKGDATLTSRKPPGPLGGGAGGRTDGSNGPSQVGFAYGSAAHWYSEEEYVSYYGGAMSSAPGDGGCGQRGGGGGGGGGSTSAAGGYGGASIFGGGGGGGGAGDSNPGPGKGGLSKYAGKGGDGGYDTTPGTAGTAPSGGGGGSETGTASGAGAPGRLEVIVI